MKLLLKLKPFDRESGNLNVIIDTPKGCRNKVPRLILRLMITS